MNAEQRRVLAAAMDRILPGGKLPGASAANAIGYVDWLTRQPVFRSAEQCLLDGLAHLESLARGRYGGNFADCSAEERDVLIRELVNARAAGEIEFFDMLMRTTLVGAFCSPAYGGNRNAVTWQAIQYEPHARTAGVTKLGH